jgi:hypothetical protein
MSASPTVHTPQQVAERRAKGPHTSMFVRMLIRAAMLRRGRAASALLAMVVAAAVATAMMNLYVDVQAKLRTEFRNYGANVVVVAREGQSLAPDSLAKVESSLGQKTLAVPFSYAVARTRDGQSVVVVGTDFTRAHQLNHWWNVTHWPNAAPPAETPARVTPPIVAEPQAPKGRQNAAHGASRGSLPEVIAQAPEGRQNQSQREGDSFRTEAAQAPEGRPNLAQRFSAGGIGKTDASPGGTAQPSGITVNPRTSGSTQAPKGRQNAAHGASRGSLPEEIAPAPEGRQRTPVEALVGMRAATVVTPNRQPFELTFQGKSIELAPAGLLQTGAGEDSRIYLDQAEFQKWIDITPSTIEIAVNGSTEEIEQGIHRLAQSLPAADVRPVRQIMEGEANVLNKTRATLYAAATLIVLTAALCVLATLIGWVFDRRRDFAIMKALGASEGLVNAFFAAEAAALGAIGATLGFGIGIGVAAWIGRANFHAPVVPRFGVFPYVLAGSVLVALISAVLPVALLRRVQPAIILRGE